MSDFDRVLERLFNDPPFAAALAADPDGALAGDRLDAEEAALLRSQVGADTGAVSGLGAWSDFGSAEGFGTAPAGGSFSALDTSDGFGSALGHGGPTGGSGAWTAGVPMMNSAHSGLGAAPLTDPDPVAARLGDAPSAFGAEVRQIAPPKGVRELGRRRR